jgi:4-hydroxymandelate oxidase
MPPSRREVLLSAAALASFSAEGMTQATTKRQAAFSTAASQQAEISAAVCVADYEALARSVLSRASWEYFSSGSADEVTLRWNREALLRMPLNPSILVDVTAVDTRINLLGQEMAHPILLAPTSTHQFAHPEGEMATVRGAGAAGATMVVSTVATHSVEEIAEAATQPLWFQLYVEDDRSRTKALIERAENAGCRALCITVDLPFVYARTREAHILAKAPQFYFPNLDITAGPGSAGRKGGRSRGFNWKDLEWIHSFAKTPIVLKGILNPDDADHAVKAGAAAIIVSNHGGRALDSVPATIDALPRVVDRVGGRIPVLFDGGIRRGTDIVKGLATGATAVLVGRPYLYGLAVNGADGVRHIIEILKTELEAAMGLLGRTSIATLDRTIQLCQMMPATVCEDLQG